MKSTKLILLHPTIQKQSSSNTNRLWLILIITFFTTAFTLILITTAAAAAATSTATGSAASSFQLRLSISNALLHYTAITNSTHMTSTKLATVTAAIARCATAASLCNLLIFGHTHEALLYTALNFNGRTVILDEDEHLILRFEQQHLGIEAYDMKYYEMRVSEMKRLLESARGKFCGECRPVQNLLFSECKLALNSLRNHVYQLSWDVILIDGPSEYHEAAPGRMSAIFTAAVLARSKKGRAAETHVFVQDFDREAERGYSDEFLCRDNLVEVVGKLGHFVVERASDERLTTEFCRVSALANSSSSSTSMA
ncbi:protein IRX15-LIKE-like [Syzygium oleosum]|uniref:protein IRX15-LIKE-like n=1 Tax=Syzygium oleosum TaxID=219896 RepID=UPI0024B8C35C|nr:protein IRX15-LIKE-like [Syzygium oleosum]